MVLLGIMLKKALRPAADVPGPHGCERDLAPSGSPRNQFLRGDPLPEPTRVPTHPYNSHEFK